MSAASNYLSALGALIAALPTAEISAGAALAAHAVRAGGMVQVFGSGHSGLVAMEVAGRASGLSAVNALRDPSLSPTFPDRAGATERVPGYVAVSFSLWGLRPEDVVVVVSNSGINAAPIEVAVLARQRSIPVIAITSIEHSSAATSRVAEGVRLYDVADVVIDTGSPYGDWTVELAGGAKVGPVSTAVAMTALHAVLVEAAEMLDRSGDRPPIIRSLNAAGGDDHNVVVQAPYRARQQFS